MLPNASPLAGPPTETPGSDRTGIFSFSAEELFSEKLFLIMTQVARNKKSEFSQQESNL